MLPSNNQYPQNHTARASCRKAVQLRLALCNSKPHKMGTSKNSTWPLKLFFGRGFNHRIEGLKTQKNQGARRPTERVPAKCEESRSPNNVVVILNLLVLQVDLQRRLLLACFVQPMYSTLNFDGYPWQSQPRPAN